VVYVRSPDDVVSTVRRSVSLPGELAEEVNRIADSRRVSPNQALVDLISDGVAAYRRRRTEFLAIAERFQKSVDPAESERLREELARMTLES
jgi:metal-responsive CopG/Arc/MetJ family transcriptional regulator